MQEGNGYLELEIETKKVDRTFFTNVDDIRQFSNVLAYVFKDGRISTFSGRQVERNNFMGPICPVMRLLTHKDANLSSYFEKYDEREKELVTHH